MAEVPQDFDPAWYAARYADVGLSGLSPRDHFRRFGRRMGRSPNGRSDVPSSPVNIEAPRAVWDAPSRRADMAVPSVASAIIDRPADLDLAMPIIPTFSRGHRNEAASLRELAKADPSPAVTALVRLFGAQAASGNDGLVTCDAEPFRSGAGRIANAWFAGRNRVRLMLADDRDASHRPLILQAYQVSASEPRLEIVDEPFLIRGDGPAFHDLRLPNRLMPILLELSDIEGAILSQTLLPFPSLLPGGLHWAELKALQTEYDPMEDFWRLSEEMLNAAVEKQSSTGSIRRVAPTSPNQHPLPGDLIGWMRALFHLELDYGPDEQGDGPVLSLPFDCIPTISALVASGSAFDGPGTVTGPYLIADADTFRPRWSVCLPSDQTPSRNIPSVISRGAHGTEPTTVTQMHLAIAFRGTYEVPARSLLPDKSAAISAMTVILHVADPSRAAALMGSLRQLIPDQDLEFLLRPTQNHGSILNELRGINGDAAWSVVPSGSDLRELASTAKHDRLLSISDRVELPDSSALAMLHAMLDEDDRVGSASCALLSQTIIKRQAVLQPAAGGIFPAGVSFATSPRLSFYEPDVMKALPNESFPVVANSFGLTLFRRHAIAALPRPMSRAPIAAEDIRLGLDLGQAGYRNMSTTKVSALLAGPYARRDVIDPFGGIYAQPGLWENLLSRVSLLRELF